MDNYTLSHPKNDCEVTERDKGYTLQKASFMHQSQDSVFERVRKHTCYDNNSLGSLPLIYPPNLFHGGKKTKMVAVTLLRDRRKFVRNIVLECVLVIF